PHICVLHDIGNQDGTDYLVLEYLEGESLSVRLKKGPLPLEHVLRIGIEIGDALDKAHLHRLIHRDIKPGNVMLTKAGAKLLDFGLARKAIPIFSGADYVLSSPTPSEPLTAKGTLTGTIPYMAPEQPMREIGRTARGVRFNKVYWSGGAIGEVPFHEEALAPEPEKAPALTTSLHRSQARDARPSDSRGSRAT